ncbi:MAG TPA: DeoR/GlpR family DNA-binding transcription regulator [Hypericibacter adhaerens]|jgi:DeoR/GlpR family transcriptional regulator of sugar metabolism|uniref:DeoR family transcriptional regulator n=1 Tax=Hypericibacter adhaerens TaxID=2602016 RepID=A0A5J6N1P4_9PROT|nr:DeoR/GlpR family DNA-binding transcription regulator [Hypericibacter adhaerens]QEX23214.1 DeoR family transcriptional regulator [Hypericibacter adhaerens]HWA44623.1 DeoR/GlpR family DNA-binding transcription regulator [Hypericibacter adhaerens]
MARQKRQPISRRNALRRVLTLRGTATVEELCAELGASPATIRRDLQALEEEGAIERGYGGATISVLHPAEEDLAIREQQDVEAKRALASTALQFVKPRCTLFLNDGSTVKMLAQQIAASDLELFIVTPAVNVAHILAVNPKITVCLLGGYVRRTSLATGGPFTESMLDMISADLAILSCDGFSARDGMCFFHAEDAAIARKMTERASETIAIVTASKFERRARIAGVPAPRLSALVTDNPRHPTAVRLAQSKIRVVEAKAA